MLLAVFNKRNSRTPTRKINMSTQSTRDGDKTVTQRGVSIDRAPKDTVCTDCERDKEKEKYENNYVHTLESMCESLDNDTDITK